MADTRRGRKSQSEYCELIMKALLCDRFALEDFPVLSQLPVVERWANEHPHELLPHGKVLQYLLRQAINDVLKLVDDGDDIVVKRIGEYLRLRYQEQVSVKLIAEQWQCSTVHVWRTIGKRAIDLVTERFLQLARTSEQMSEKKKVTTQIKK